MVVGKRCITIAIHGAGATVSVGRIAVEGPEANSREAVGLRETTDRIDVGQTRDLVLRIVLSKIDGEADVAERNARLLVEGLCRLDRGLSHVAAVVHHHAVVRIGRAVIHRHQVDDEVATQI